MAFKAEYGVSEGILVKKAVAKLKECNGDLIVANDVSRKGCHFGSDTNEIYIIDKEKNIIHIALESKKEIAKKLVTIISKKLNIGQ